METRLNVICSHYGCTVPMVKSTCDAHNVTDRDFGYANYLIKMLFASDDGIIAYRFQNQNC